MYFQAVNLIQHRVLGRKMVIPSYSCKTQIISVHTRKSKSLKCYGLDGDVWANWFGILSPLSWPLRPFQAVIYAVYSKLWPGCPIRFLWCQIWDDGTFSRSKIFSNVSRPDKNIKFGTGFLLPFTVQSSSSTARWLYMGRSPLAREMGSILTKASSLRTQRRKGEIWIWEWTGK